MRIYTRISVVIKEVIKKREKISIKTFTDLSCPDKLISSRTKLLPKGCEILEIGVGERFLKDYQKKYRKKL